MTETKNSWANYIIGKAHSLGLHDFKKCKRIAHNYYHEVADNYPPAMYEVGLYYYELGADHHGKALAFLKKAAQKGELKANWLLAKNYDFDSILGSGMERAAAYYKVCADAGLPSAQCRLGVLFYKGSGVEKNFETAHQLFTQAAQKNIPDAYYWLGVMSENGDGVKQNLEGAKRFYQKAIDANSHYQAPIDRLAAIRNGTPTSGAIDYDHDL